MRVPGGPGCSSPCGGGVSSEGGVALLRMRVSVVDEVGGGVEGATPDCHIL